MALGRLDWSRQITFFVNRPLGPQNPTLRQLLPCRIGSGGRACRELRRPDLAPGCIELDANGCASSELRVLARSHASLFRECVIIVLAAVGPWFDLRPY